LTIDFVSQTSLIAALVILNRPINNQQIYILQVWISIRGIVLRQSRSFARKGEKAALGEGAVSPSVSSSAVIYLCSSVLIRCARQFNDTDAQAAYVQYATLHYYTVSQKTSLA